MKTKMKIEMKIKQMTMALVVLLIMTACSDAEKNKLDNRAADYWKYKIGKDFKKAYQFLTPGWRKTDSEAAFTQRMVISKVKWLDSKVNKKECSKPDLCIVTMNITYEYQFKSSGSQKIEASSKIKETWILKENIWYHLPLQKKMSQ